MVESFWPIKVNNPQQDVHCEGYESSMKKPEKHLSEREMDRIIGMAWEDRTPFEAIEDQFGLKEKDVIRLMRRQLHPRSWRNWRARVQGRPTKHRKIRKGEVDRFRSAQQRQVSLNKPSKPKP